MASKRRIRTVLTGGFLVTGLAGAVVLASPAAAAAADAGAAGRIAGLDGAAPAVCRHLDKISQRESKLIARLGADATTKGSIAWLKAKADAATQAGETQLAAMYTDRATRRSHLLDTLNAIGPDLAALVKAHCS